MFRFISSLWFILLLLLSNGMLSTVVDLCCLNEEHSNETSACSNHAEFNNYSNPPTTSSCCENKLVVNTCQTYNHNTCDWYSWYYFTPKFFDNLPEKSSPNRCIELSKVLFEYTKYNHRIESSQVNIHSRNGPKDYAVNDKGISALNCVWII